MNTTEQRVIPEHRISISGNDLLGLSGLVLLLVCSLGAIVYLNWSSWGMWAVIGAGVILGSIAGWKVYTSIHGHALHHIDRRHQHKDIEHRRSTVTQALSMGCSVQVKYPDGSEMNIIHPTAALAANASSTTIKQLNMAQQEEQALLPAPLPEPFTLSSVLGNWYPSKSGILLAKSTEPGLLTVPIGEDLCHTSFTGRTGGGKTSKQRLLLVQLLFLQQVVYLCDKSFQRFRQDKRNGTIYDYRPIEQLLAKPPITRTVDVVRLLKELYSELEDRRNTNRYMIKRHKDIYTVLDELPAFADEDKTIMAYIGKLLRESRQYGIFFCGASQDLLNTTLKNDNGAIRENLLTNFYDGGDASTARMVLDLQKNDKLDETGLGTHGISYLRAKGISLPHTRVRTALADNQATFTLLGDMTGIDPQNMAVPSEFPVSSGPVPIVDSLSNGNQDGNYSELENEKLGVVLEMIVQEKGMSEIASTAFPGMRKEDALKEVRRCMKQLVQRG